jgi:hypothetical protein
MPPLQLPEQHCELDVQLSLTPLGAQQTLFWQETYCGQ